MSEICHLDQPLESHHHEDQGGSIKQRQNSEKARQKGTHPEEKRKNEETNNNRKIWIWSSTYRSFLLLFLGVITYMIWLLQKTLQGESRPIRCMRSMIAQEKKRHCLREATERYNRHAI